MTVCGIDLSTFAVDAVFLDLDTARAEWRHWPLGPGADSFDRCRTVRDALPPRGWWTDEGVIAVGIEEPAGRNPGHQFRVQGAILACLPASLLVEKWMPAQWRKAVGLPGNATKQLVMQYVTLKRGETGEFGPSGPHAVGAGLRLAGEMLHWTQDACDAYCLAVATRNALVQEAA